MIDTILKTAIEQAAAESWRPVNHGDPNTIDVYDHAGKVLRILHLHLPTDLPSKEIGIKIVELVDNNFIKGVFIRECKPPELSERGEHILYQIQEQKLLPFSPSENYVVALYIWHGCICMAKSVRKTFVISEGNEESYTPDRRRQEYNGIQQCWQQEENKGNLWVRYGVSLARSFRSKGKVDDWVPKDSPYWL
jgi:hypothetical protein